jgi:polynucleotide 5'-hydroxyl-kinase GRC3/NOL9
MELPIWGMLDFRDTDEGVAGIERGLVSYLQWGRVPEGVVGCDRRRVRRNLMRRGQAYALLVFFSSLLPSSSG